MSRWTSERRWGECRKAAELANMLDAMPAELRGQIIGSIFDADRNSVDFEEAYVTGMCRSLIADAFQELLPRAQASLVRTIFNNDVTGVLGPLDTAKDPAEVQLVVCDLLELVTSNAEAAQ